MPTSTENPTGQQVAMVVKKLTKAAMLDRDVKLSSMEVRELVVGLNMLRVYVETYQAGARFAVGGWTKGTGGDAGACGRVEAVELFLQMLDCVGLSSTTPS